MSNGYIDPVMRRRAIEAAEREKRRQRQQQPGESFVVYQERLARQDGAIDASSELSLSAAERHELSIIRSQIASGMAGVQIPEKFMRFVKDELPSSFGVYDPIAAQRLRNDFQAAMAKSADLEVQGSAFTDTVAPQPISATMKKVLQLVAPGGIDASHIKVALRRLDAILDDLGIAEPEKRHARFEAWQMGLIHEYSRPAAASTTKKAPVRLQNPITCSSDDWR
jgi:hypothetical protein